MHNKKIASDIEKVVAEKTDDDGKFLADKRAQVGVHVHNILLQEVYSPVLARFPNRRLRDPVVQDLKRKRMNDDT
jgi:hypothetical protein